ncbi:MAG: DUF5689 domain-containing protein [Bergeyella zoohelcum]|nr:DUF5689 domain-containing protein [Bergeyella zoohelcum]
MKKYSYIKALLLSAMALFATSCVQDDKYGIPDSSANYQCADLTANTTFAKVKAMTQNEIITEDLILEGYVSSSDEAGNIYKTIFIQDDPTNPTHGLTIGVNASSLYIHYPQGAKVYIKLKGLSVGEYGGLIQIGEMVNGKFDRVQEKNIPTNIIKSCGEVATITPKEMTLADMKTANDNLLGVLVKVPNAQFHANALCSQYAPDGATVTKSLTDATFTGTSRVVRNSGYATFARNTIPSGNGDFVGIVTKYSTTYQLYIVRESDLKMAGNRTDNIVATCAPSATSTAKTIAEVKSLLASGSTMTQITEDFTLTARVTANDEKGNLYKYIYIEDETGGIRVNINQTSLYQDRRYQVGRTLTISLKDLYIGTNGGEYQIGVPYNGNIGQIAETDTYKHFFRSEQPIVNITPTEVSLATLSKTSADANVGRWVTIKDLQFIASDLGKTYATGTANTNRTLEDCNGNTIILRTSGRADFGTRDEPLKASSIEVEVGKGNVTGILSYYNGEYQLWITKLRDIDLDNPRCDGTLPAKSYTLFEDGFTDLSNWTAISVKGAEVWTTTTYGNPRPSAYFSANRKENEDWLISNTINLTGYKNSYLSFETDGRYSGKPLEAYITTNYTGDVATTQWTKLDATFDTDMNAFAGFISSGKISLAAYEGKSIRVAFKYTSVSGASTNWEVDNVLIKGEK